MEGEFKVLGIDLEQLTHKRILDDVFLSQVEEDPDVLLKAYNTLDLDPPSIDDYEDFEDHEKEFLTDSDMVRVLTVR